MVETYGLSGELGALTPDHGVPEIGTELSVDEFADIPDGVEENKDWPIDNVNRFWFIQIQALGKLYRKDNLISAHLANANCNEALVMQMIMRDRQYGTNHHRYGYSEELEYVKELGKVPYSSDDPVFNRIADQIYAAALAYANQEKVLWHLALVRE